MIYKFTRWISSKRGSRITLISWLFIVIVLTAIAPGAKDFAISTGEGSIHDNIPSAKAQTILEEQFQTNDGLVALLVFHSQTAINLEEREKIEAISAWLASDKKPDHVASAIPFHQLSQNVQNQLLSEDQTTLLLNVALQKDLESSQIQETLEQIRIFVEEANMANLQFVITGPAGILADTINLFSNADMVLLFSTIGLILLILIIIYRSPLLSIIPLIIAGIVYQVVDRILGLAAENGWFIVDKQALSIMMILLFAVLTDYCLFVLSRYREELKRIDSKHDAMKAAMSQIAEPILFSGGTVLMAVMVLFFAIFQPYHYFAPVFSVAMVVILLGGLTLIPAVFTLFGRKAFWPFIPKLGDVQSSRIGFWTRMGTFVTKKPKLVSSLLLILMVVASFNTMNIKYSFNLLNSFPDDISSRQGFELLEERFPEGRLAPVTILLKSDQEIQFSPTFANKLTNLTTSIQAEKGINEITPKITSEIGENNALLSKDFISKDTHTIKLQMMLQENPYESSSLNVIESLRDSSELLLKNSGLDPMHFSLHYAGQTAEQLDVRDMNQRDTIVIFSLIIVFISIMLVFQSKSIVIALVMMATMLLSYAAALGLSWTIFNTFLELDAISYRLPVYTFVFLIALGVDYNIMLVSRILEEERKLPWKEAIQQGVSKTGGVISSAGIILAATFSVLMTQPLQELFLFGFTMAVGVIMDTFLIRGMLLPSILTLLKRKVR